MQDHAYKQWNPFGLKGDIPEKLPNQLSHPSLSHVEQECHEILIQGKIHIQQNLNEGLKYL